MQLTVAVNSDSIMEFKPNISEQQRLELVASLECVDKAFITKSSVLQLINKLRPQIIVKGKEFESRDNPELEGLKKYGGKLIFGSGEFELGSDFYMKSLHNIGSSFDFSELKPYAQRHDIQLNDLLGIVKAMSQLKVAVIGEIIVDEYVQGTAVGLSQEDPTIVMTPNHTSTFLGGAAITAGHIKSIGAKEVTLLSVVGDDNKAIYVKEHINDYDLNTFIIEDSSRPTPLKTRYRVDRKTLLRVNHVRHHKISEELQIALYEGLKNVIKKIDILVFSDFNYGVLPQDLVEKVVSLCHTFNVKVVADSQTSSQVGDISRYRDTHLITPTEKEVRVALNNADDGLVILAKKLCDKCNPQSLVITLAAEGVFIHIPSKDGETWQNDRIPAINQNAADPAGAGDCFMAASSLAITAGATPWQAFYIASIASACQVDVVGNTPLLQSTLINSINMSFQ